jgi:hypothetical protein
MKKNIFLASLFGCVIMNASFTPAWAQISVLLEPQDQMWNNPKPPTPDTGYVEPVTIYYYCFEPTILLAPSFQDDTINFRLALNSKGDTITHFPISLLDTIGVLTVYIAYFPDAAPHSVQVVWTTQPANSPDEVFWVDTLTGVGIRAAVTASNQTDLSASVITLDDGHSIEIVPAGNTTAPLTFQLFDLLGKNVLLGSISGTQIVSVATLPRGVYFYRLTSGDRSQSGKVMLGE